MKDLVGKVAFITGGASGIGLAMAQSFSAAGMKVVVADIEQAALDAVAEEFAKTNAEILTVQVDVTDRKQMEAAADATQNRFGKVHLLVNNAGVGVSGTMDTMTYADWDWVLGVNLNGVVNGLQTFIERIKQHGEGGHIVNTASMAGHLAVPGLGVYNASKWAVVGISETLKADLSPYNIGVSVLCPGVVKTNIISSMRNRPDALGGEASEDSPVQAVGDTDTQDASHRIADIMESGLDASVVGDMVLHAIQTDELYIFTHPEFKAAVAGRIEQMNAAFDRWQQYREEYTS